MNNTTAIAKEFKDLETSSVIDAATLLGPSFNFPRAGIIRPGIMVPKRSCSSGDLEQYKTLVEKGISWDDIDRELGLDNNKKSKLVPKNVDYFTIRSGDCTNPDNMEKIHKQYADADGKLRSFPVVFPINEWWNVIPHSLRCFGSNGIKFKSDFRYIKDAEGQTIDVERICTFPQNPEPGKRVFGGRDWGERACNPELCKEYQREECKFGGTIQFLIPGIPGIGVWILPTVSWYSLKGIKDSLHLLSRVTGGRISGLMGKPPLGIFRIRKKKDTISRIDKKMGKAVKTDQWIITLDADVDLTSISSSYEGEKVVDMGARAVGMLTGETSSMEPEAAQQIPSEQEEDHEQEQEQSKEEEATPDTKTDQGNETSAETSAPSATAEATHEEARTETSRNHGTGSTEKNSHDGNGKKEMTPSAKLLWDSISKLHRDGSKRKEALKRLTNKDSFFDLTEEEASKGLETLADSMLNKF